MTNINNRLRRGPLNDVESYIQENINKYVNKIVYQENTKLVKIDHQPVYEKKFKEVERLDVNQIFHCNICHAKFTENSSLKIHMKSFHEGPFICEVCAVEFGSKTSLEKHAAITHQRYKLFRCTYCDLLFLRKGTLKIHIQGKAGVYYDF